MTQSLTPGIEIICDIAARFPLEGRLTGVQRHGSGHINDTFLVEFDVQGICRRFIFQRINHHIFKNVPELMENIRRVTLHLAGKTRGNDPRHALRLVPETGGCPYCKTPGGDCWRVYHYLEGTRSYDAIKVPRQAFEAAREFGRFQQSLADLPGGRLHETIPHFHNTPRRFEALHRAVAEDIADRRKEVAAELDLAFGRETEAGRLLDLVRSGDMPERITHNDTKINNVMFDDKTDEALCVIDLDTVMPGLSLYDFGDLVRSGANTAFEDETDLSKIDVSLPVFEALVQGYVAGAGDILTEAEWDHLVFAGKLITLEIGIRFLTDYLQGDHYFKIARPRHNLERARNQLRLVERIEQSASAMSAIVRRQHTRN